MVRWKLAWHMSKAWQESLSPIGMWYIKRYSATPTEWHLYYTPKGFADELHAGTFHSEQSAKDYAQTWFEDLVVGITKMVAI